MRTTKLSASKNTYSVDLHTVVIICKDKTMNSLSSVNSNSLYRRVMKEPLWRSTGFLNFDRRFQRIKVKQGASSEPGSHAPAPA